MADPIVVYCLKCKAKREMRDPQPVFVGGGKPATQGACAECGTRLTRMGRTAAHEGLEAPAPLSDPLPSKEKVTGLKLVIVESPAKAKTIAKFLGRGYTVKASIGHIRDLPANRMGVDVEHDFAPRYVIPEKKKDVVKTLRQEAKA